MSLGKSSALIPVYVPPNAAMPRNLPASGPPSLEDVVCAAHPSDTRNDVHRGAVKLGIFAALHYVYDNKGS